MAPAARRSADSRRLAMSAKSRRLVRLEDLVGRAVNDMSGRRIGRIQEVVAEIRESRYEVVEYRLGSGALFDRLSITSRLFGRKPETVVVRWDQLDIHEPRRPRLVCGEN